MTEPTGSQCARCGAQLKEASTSCWLCHHPVTEGIEFVSDHVQMPTHVGGPTFSIMSLLLMMTMVAVILGVFIVAPGLGVLLGVLFLPAFIRTVVIAGRHKVLGQRLDGGQKFSVFMAALAGVIVAGVAAVVAFFGTCGISCLGYAASNGRSGELFVLMLYVGIGVGILTAVLVLRKMWARS